MKSKKAAGNKTVPFVHDTTRPKRDTKRSIPHRFEVPKITPSHVNPELTHLHLETLRSSATTGTLELASLGLDMWLLVLVWSETEMLDSLSSVLWSTEEEGVGSGWGSQCELIESEGLTTGSENSGAGSSGEL